MFLVLVCWFFDNSSTYKHNPGFGTFSIEFLKGEEDIRISGKWTYLVEKIQSLKALGTVINVKKYCLISSPNLKGRCDRKVIVSGGQGWHLEPEAWHTSCRRQRLYLVTWLNVAKYRQLIQCDSGELHYQILQPRKYHTPTRRFYARYSRVGQNQYLPIGLTQN